MPIGEVIPDLAELVFSQLLAIVSNGSGWLAWMLSAVQKDSMIMSSKSNS